MFARPDASAASASTGAPKPADLGALPAMRQTLNDFSLDSLSSLLDDELTLDTPAPPATSAPVNAPASAPSPAAIAAAPAPPAPAPIDAMSAPVPTEAVGTQLFGTQLVGTQVVGTQLVGTQLVGAQLVGAQLAGTQLVGTQLVSIPSPRKSAVAEGQVPLAARESSLDETQLYKSTPQPTIDLSVVRRSASEPTQAFAGNLADLTDVGATSFLPAHVSNTMPADVSNTMPARIDPSKSSVPETTFWTAADRDSALLEAHPSASAVPSVGATELISPGAFPVPQESPEHDDSPAVTTPRTIAQHLAGFFGGQQPKRTTEVKWEQAVESDRRFTTMLLSDLDEAMNQPLSTDSDPSVPFALPIPPSAPPAFAPAPFAAEATVTSPVGGQPAAPVAYDTLEVVGAEQPLAPPVPAAPVEPTPLVSSPAFPSTQPASSVPAGRANLPEPTPEVRQLAACVLERSTPGVSTVVAIVGCDETGPGADATLALAAAVADATGVSTLVVDGDFAKRDLSRTAGAVDAPGFAETLAQSTKSRSLAQSAGRDNLQVLPAGVSTPEASEAPARVSAWIARAKQEHGLILVWLGSSAGEYERRLCGAADLSLLLATVDKDRPSRIEAAAERLRSVNARTLGVALVKA